MSRQVGSPKGAKAKADKYFSLIIRSRGACQCCGDTAYLQCAHIISRRYSHTRCDPRNAFCLCAKCHHHFTDHPAEFGMFVTEQIGDEIYWEIARLSRLPGKVDWVKVAADKKSDWDLINA